MFKKKLKIKKPPKEAAPQTKKAVTSSLIMTVVALSLCFGILIGGIDSNTDITDIFTYEPDDIRRSDIESVPVSYSNSKLTAIFDMTDENNIKLNYYDTQNNSERQIIFSFDSDSRIASVGEKIADNVQKNESDNSRKPPEIKNELKNEDASEKEETDVIPILEFEYEDSSIVRRREYRNSELYRTVKTETSVERDSSKNIIVQIYSSDAELTESNEYSFDRYSNPTFYASYDKDNIQISGFTRTYAYDSNGNIISSTLTDYGSEPIECVYRYDERNNLVYSSTFNKDLATTVTTYAYVYDSKSRITQAAKSVSYPSSGVSNVTDEKYEYDENNLISKTITDSSQHTLFSGSYVYSRDNKMIRSTETDNGGENTISIGYEYITGSLYTKMTEINSVWDVLSCAVKDTYM